MNNKEIGERIYSTRDELGLTLKELSQKVGVAISTIQRYEKGEIEKIKLPVIQSIAHALSVNPSWLIGESDNKYLQTKSITIQNISLDSVENEQYNRILSYYNKLNNKGKVEALRRIEELTMIPRYTESYSYNLKESSSSFEEQASYNHNRTLKAAHSIPDSSDTDMENDIKMMLDDSNW